jgi:hypothetical protein
VTPRDWRVSGSYFEACNCEAICPCRQVGGRDGGRSTTGICQFALSWIVAAGHADDLDLAGREAVLAGWYSDDEAGSPWRVVLWVDADATDAQVETLADIFLGGAGGTALTNFAAAIGEVHAVRRAAITLVHTRGRQSIDVPDEVQVRALHPVETTESVSCAIPGHDHPGQEGVAEMLRVDALPLQWEVTGRCSFSSDYDYRADG